MAGDANQSVIKSYKAVFDKKPEWSNRTSYVITPDHKIAMVWSDLKPDERRHPHPRRGEGLEGPKGKKG